MGSATAGDLGLDVGVEGEDKEADCEVLDVAMDLRRGFRWPGARDATAAIAETSINTV